MIGDYVDRGPASLGVLRRLIGLEQRSSASRSISCAATTTTT